MTATPNLDRLVGLVADKGGSSYGKSADEQFQDDVDAAHDYLRKECHWYDKASAGAPVADHEQHCRAEHGEPPKLVVKLTPHTAEASTVDKPTRPPGGPGLFHVKGLHLPPYIQHLWFHLVKEYGEKKAYGVAVGVVHKWAQGVNPGGWKKKGGAPGHVHADVQAAAARNVAQWDADRAKAHEQSAKHDVKATVELTDSGTISKEDAGYKSGGTPGHRCGDCSMFRHGSCTLVRGVISASAVCDKFEPARKNLTVSLAVAGAGATPFEGDKVKPLPATPGYSAPMFTAHRVNELRVQLAHAAERMGAARSSTDPKVRAYEMLHIYNHLIEALDSVHQLFANYRDNYPAEGREIEAMKGLVGLNGKSVTPRCKAATTAHLTETIANELTHAKRHADLMLTGKPDEEWNFNADHCQKHLIGATEHAAKLDGHLRANYPQEAKWLARLQLEPGEEHAGSPGLRKSVHLAGEVYLDGSSGGGLGGGAVVTAPGAQATLIPPPPGGKYSQYGLHQKPSQTVSPSPPLPPSVPAPTAAEVRKLIPMVPESADESLSRTVKDFLETAAVKLEKDDELAALQMLRSATTAVYAAHKADIGTVMPAYYTADVFSRIPPAAQSSAGQAILESQKQREQWRALHFAVMTLADRIRKRYFHGQYNGPVQSARLSVDDLTGMTDLDKLLALATKQSVATGQDVSFPTDSSDAEKAPLLQEPPGDPDFGRLKSPEVTKELSVLDDSDKLRIEAALARARRVVKRNPVAASQALCQALQIAKECCCYHTVQQIRGHLRDIGASENGTLPAATAAGQPGSGKGSLSTEKPSGSSVRMAADELPEALSPLRILELASSAGSSAGSSVVHPQAPHGTSSGGKSMGGLGSSASSVPHSSALHLDAHQLHELHLKHLAHLHKLHLEHVAHVTHMHHKAVGSGAGTGTASTSGAPMGFGGVRPHGP